MKNNFMKMVFILSVVITVSMAQAKQHDIVTAQISEDSIICPQTVWQISVSPGQSIVESLLQLNEVDYLKNCVFTIDEEGRLTILGSKKKFQQRESRRKERPDGDNKD